MYFVAVCRVITPTLYCTVQYCRYSSIACLQYSCRVSGRNRRGSAPTERSKSFLRVTRPDFSSSWRLFLKIYWSVLLRTLQWHLWDIVLCHCKVLKLEVFSVLRYSCQGIQIYWTLFGYLYRPLLYWFENRQAVENFKNFEEQNKAKART